MTQIFIFGSSTAYGVGATHGGWADRLKLALHQKLYDQNGVGEEHELYNFAQSGATIQFVVETYAELLKHYRRHEKTLVILSIGANNASARDTIDNFVSMPEEFSFLMRDLIQRLKRDVDQLFVLGYHPCDDRKTQPKSNSAGTKHAYFWKERTMLFDSLMKEICVQENVEFIVPFFAEKEWIQNCLYEDGLHPNDAGHQMIFEAVCEQIKVKTDIF